MKAELENSRKESAAQKWLHITDSQVINNFMKKVEDLNTALGDKENAISRIHSELDDLKQQHQYLQEHFEEKVGGTSLKLVGPLPSVFTGIWRFNESGLLPCTLFFKFMGL